MTSTVATAHETTMTRPRRPAAVTVLAIIQLASALIYGLILLGLLIDDTATMEAIVAAGGGVSGVALTVEIAALRTFVAGLFLGAASGGILLLRMRRLGWTITMLMTGLGLATSISTWLANGTVVSLWLAVQVVTVFYLNQRQVRQAFGIVHRTGAAPEASRG